jgi:hypothetical protein
MIHRVRELISLIGPISPIRVVAPTIRARGRYGPDAVIGFWLAMVEARVG